MSKSKLTRLVLLAGGTMLAIGGCAGGGGWLPWLIEAGFVATLLSQRSA